MRAMDSQPKMICLAVCETCGRRFDVAKDWYNRDSMTFHLDWADRPCECGAVLTQVASGVPVTT